MTTRNGAQLLMQTFLDNGVDTVIGNPGTSEMQFVAALDSVPKIHAVLALFEGVVTGAADGYGRMADKPAATLLHLGPGLGNGLANLHNARRAHTPIVNVVGEHATFHRQYDPPLHSDIASIAKGASEWTRTMESASKVADDVAAAVGASLESPGKVATLILPADVAWGEAKGEPKKAVLTKAPRPAPSAVDEVAKILQGGEKAALLLNGRGTRTASLRVASSIGKKTGARVMCDTFPARLERGAGRPVVERLPYIPQMILSLIADVKHIVLVGARAPVSFFAFPNGPSTAVPEGARSTRWPPSRRTSAALWRCSPAPSARRTIPSCSRRSCRRRPRAGRSSPTLSAARSPRRFRRTPSSSTSRTPSASSRRWPRPAARRTTGSR